MKFQHPDMKDRIGRFSIPERLIREEPEMVVGAMAGFLVVRAYCDFSSRSICYEAYSHLFDKVTPGCMSPEYDITVTTIDNYTHVHAERMS